MPTSTSPSGGEVDQLNAKISELEAGLTRLQAAITKLQEQRKISMQQGAPTAPSGGKVSQLVAQLNGRIAVLEEEVCRIQGKYHTVGRQWKWTLSSCKKLGYDKPLK